MSLWKIAWRSIEQRALSSALTALSMALGVALVVAVLVIYGTVSDSFRQSAQGYDLIVGAKGGKLQLVLNTVYHLSTPIENIPWSYYQEFRQGKFAPMVALAVPMCLGDNYQGFRVVGTLPELFEHEYAQGHRYAFAQGKNFHNEKYFEAVIGAQVARSTGLRAGDSFQPTHGISTEEGQGHKHDAFHVMGVLEPTGTPNDRALFVNIEGFFLLEGHAKPVASNAPNAEHAEHEHADGSPADTAEHAEHAEHADAEHEHAEHEHAEHEHAEHEHADGSPADTAEHAEHAEHADAEHEHAEHEHAEHEHAPLPESQREVTAILVRTANPLFGMDLPRLVNEGNVAQAVFPIREIYDLFDGIVGNIQWLLLLLASLVVVVSGIGMMVSIYNSMSDRQREIGVMRALGASRTTVMLVVLVESILLAVGGGVLGIVLGHGGIGLLHPWIVNQTGVSIGFLRFQPLELVLLPVLVLLASVVGFLPALAAYRTDVAKALAGTA